MKHVDFAIGIEFWCGGRRWRCTDVGTRVIVAISLDPHEVVEMQRAEGMSGRAVERRYMSEDKSWLDGPPYAVAEYVFDEYSIEACSVERAEV